MNGNLTGSLAQSIKSYMQNEEQRIVDDTRTLINAGRKTLQAMKLPQPALLRHFLPL